MPVIFDEVFAGLHRLGLESAAPLLGATPDIAVYAKILTGGLLPLAATLRDLALLRASDTDLAPLLPPAPEPNPNPNLSRNLNLKLKHKASR